MTTFAAVAISLAFIVLSLLLALLYSKVSLADAQIKWLEHQVKNQPSPPTLNEEPIDDD